VAVNCPVIAGGVTVSAPLSMQVRHQLCCAQIWTV
jgi:hypothetical protein